MGFNGAAYLTRTNRLLASGRGLLLALHDSAGDATIAGLEEAAKPSSVAELGFQTGADAVGAVDPDDSLRAILFEVQSANVLIAAGLATEVPQPTASPLSRALDQIEQTQYLATPSSSSFLFAAGSSVKSTDLNAAKRTFRTDAQFALDRVVTEAAELIDSVSEQLKKLDPGKIAEAIQNLGKPFQDAVDAGRLLKKGVERLKNAIRSLLDLLGSGALDHVREYAADLWGRLVKGDYTRDMLTWIFEVKDTEARIDSILGGANIEIADLDSASNELRPLTDSYDNKVAIIKCLLGAIVLITSALAFLNVAVPWLPLLLGGAYIALLGAAILIGITYARGSNILHWGKGIREIADGLAPASGNGG